MERTYEEYCARWDRMTILAGRDAHERGDTPFTKSQEDDE